MPDTMPNKKTPEGNPEHFQHPKAYDSSPEGISIFLSNSCGVSLLD
jgi:hypothetical protein